MEEGKLYILQNVTVLKNGVEFRLANHEYKLEITRFSVVTSMVSESLNEFCCLRPIPLGAFTEAFQILAYCIDIVVVLL